MSYFLLPKLVFTQIKKRYLDGKVFWRIVNGKILIKTPYKTFDNSLKYYKLTEEEFLKY